MSHCTFQNEVDVAMAKVKRVLRPELLGLVQTPAKHVKRREY